MVFSVVTLAAAVFTTPDTENKLVADITPFISSLAVPRPVADEPLDDVRALMARRERGELMTATRPTG